MRAFLIYFCRAVAGLRAPLKGGLASGRRTRCPTLSYPCCSTGKYGHEDFDPASLSRSTIGSTASSTCSTSREMGGRRQLSSGTTSSAWRGPVPDLACVRGLHSNHRRTAMRSIRRRIPGADAACHGERRQKLVALLSEARTAASVRHRQLPGERAGPSGVEKVDKTVLPRLVFQQGFYLSALA